MGKFQLFTYYLWYFYVVVSCFYRYQCEDENHAWGRTLSSRWLLFAFPMPEDYFSKPGLFIHTWLWTRGIALVDLAGNGRKEGKRVWQYKASSSVQKSNNKILKLTHNFKYLLETNLQVKSMFKNNNNNNNNTNNNNKMSLTRRQPHPQVVFRLVLSKNCRYTVAKNC